MNKGQEGNHNASGDNAKVAHVGGNAGNVQVGNNFHGPIQMIFPAAAVREDKEADPRAVKALEKALAQKEAEIASFLKEQVVSSRQELQAALDKDKASLPDAKGIKLKKVNASIAVYEEALGELDKLERERSALEQQLAAITGKPPAAAASVFKVSAIGAAIVGSKGAAIAQIKKAPKGGVQVEVKADQARIEGSEGAVIGGIEFC